MSNEKGSPGGRTARSLPPRKKHRRIRLTTVVAVFIFIYIAAQFILFLKNEKFSYVVAKNGEIEQSFSLDGVVTREEQLFRAGTDGVVEYYYPGRQTLPKSTLVCSIQDDYYGDLLNEKLEDIYREMDGIKGSEEYLDEFKQADLDIASAVAQYLREKDDRNFSQVYDVKESLETAVARRKDLYALLQNKRINALQREQGVIQSQQQESKSSLYLSEAGIIEYSYDGFEGWTPEQIESDFVKTYDGKYEYLNINLQKVEQDAPLYRLISSQDWYITVFVPAEIAEFFSEKKSVTFYYNGEDRLRGSIVALEQYDADQYRLTLKMGSHVQDYLTDRIVSLKFIVDDYKGIKIPDACVVTETFCVLPQSYLFTSGTETGVLKQQGEGDPVFVPVTVSWKDSESQTCYVQLPESLHSGDVLRMEGSQETTTISNFEDVEGVYVINGGYESFHRITRLYQSNGYSIIEGVDLYDRILIPSKSAE